MTQSSLGEKKKKKEAKNDIKLINYFIQNISERNRNFLDFQVLDLANRRQTVRNPIETEGLEKKHNTK